MHALRVSLALLLTASVAPWAAPAAEAASPSSACSASVASALPSWAKAAGWRLTCRRIAPAWRTNDYARTVVVNSSHSSARQRASLVAAMRSVPREFRNNPQADCLAAVKVEAPQVSKANPGWRIQCVAKRATYRSEGLGTSSEGIMGVAIPAQKVVKVFTPGQTTNDVQATLYHEVGHVISFPWGKSPILRWVKVAKVKAWGGSVYEASGSEIFAESYANYRMKGRLQYPVVRLLPPSAVASQLRYAATKRHEAPAVGLWARATPAL